jgi:uncharacterized protein
MNLNTINPFIKKANEGKNDLWRYILTLALILILNIISSLSLIFVGLMVTGTMDFWNWPPNLMLLAAMLPFGLSLTALWVGVKFLHGRSFLGLVTAAKKIRWKSIWLSFGLWFALSCVSDLGIWLWHPGDIHWTFKPETFFPYMILALLLVPIQTSTEELLFRGYLTQWVGYLTKGIILPLLLPAIIFGLLHSFNLEMQMYDYGILILFYVLMGLLLAWITIRSRGLEFALGLHFANNLYASLITTYPGSSLNSPALFSYQDFDPALSLILFVIMAAIYLQILRIISRLQKISSV